MNLSLLLWAPLVTAVIVLLCKSGRQVRAVALTGAVLQLILAFALLFRYQQERSGGNTAVMLFESDRPWFRAWNIHFHVGVDGIAIAMILLTAFVVLAGILVSWTVETLTREFFFLLLLLSL